MSPWVVSFKWRFSEKATKNWIISSTYIDSTLLSGRFLKFLWPPENVPMNFIHIFNLILYKSRVHHKGLFTNYVDKIWLFLTTEPPLLTFSMVWTTYLPRLVDVVCERPLKTQNSRKLFYFSSHEWIIFENQING